MDHFKILKRAWQITWKYRALWLVGLLLVLAGGGIGGGFGGGSSAGGGGSGRGSSGGGPGDWNLEGPKGFPDMHWMQTHLPPIAVAILIVFGLLVLLGIVLGIVAAVVKYVTRGSLIRMVESYEETGEQTGFRRGLRLGWSRSALRMFLIDLMTKLPLALLMVLTIAPLVGFAVWSFTAGGESRVVLGVVLLLLIIPIVMIGIVLGIVLRPILEISYRICVVEDRGAWQSFKSAIGLIRRHLGPTALQWLLLVGLRIAWGIALIPVNLLLVVFALLVGGLPALLVGFVAAQAAEWPVGVALGALILIPAFLIVVGLPNLALNTLATVYHSTAWTLTYRELDLLDVGAEIEADSEVESGSEGEPELEGEPGSPVDFDEDVEPESGEGA